MAKNAIKIVDVQNKKTEITDIIKTAEQLQEKCSKYGINAFQPGAIKELKTALILGHNWISTKAQADACSVDNKCFYEYLSATEKGNGQIDRFFKDGPKNTEQHEKYEQSMQQGHDAFAAFFNIQLYSYGESAAIEVKVRIGQLWCIKCDLNCYVSLNPNRSIVINK